jgi:hypothetical protein
MPAAAALLTDAAVSAARQAGREHNDARRAARVDTSIQRAAAKAEAERLASLRRLRACAATVAAAALLVEAVAIGSLVKSWSETFNADNQPWVSVPIQPNAQPTPLCAATYTPLIDATGPGPTEVMHNAVVVLEFQGTYWKTPAGAKQATDLNTWLASLSGTRYMDVFNSYSDANGPIGTKMDVRAVYDPTNPPALVCFGDTAQEVTKMLPEAASLVPSGDQPIYLVILPPPTSFGDSPGWCGVHSTFTTSDGTRVVYGAVAAGHCIQVLSTKNTVVHEVAEALGDPYLNNSKREIGDPCQSKPLILIKGDYAPALWDEAFGRCQVQADLLPPEERPAPPGLERGLVA